MNAHMHTHILIPFEDHKLMGLKVDIAVGALSPVNHTGIISGLTLQQLEHRTGSNDAHGGA